MESVSSLGGVDLRSFLSECNAVGLYFLIVLGCIYAISGLDDFFVDMVAWLGGCWPQRLAPERTEQILRSDEKAIAIVVPAWEEWEVIARMLNGNVSRIDYKNYHIFVGVYPNDSATIAEVRSASHASSHVHAVVNDRPGPTSKGQVLNHTIDWLLEREREYGIEFAAILMHDAEDVIHPLSLKLVSDSLDRHDFIQIPVFSLQRSFQHLVAGTYIDEFSESHTKDLLVRTKLGAAVPSAGVGTAIARGLIDQMRRQNDGKLFNELSLTEDYELGLRAYSAKAAAHFSCVWYEDKRTGRREFIATREYFPKTFRQSVRQKTRWITGIVFQGARNLGWRDGLVNCYFLARDRKAVLTNLATLLGYVTLAMVALYAWLIDPLPMRSAFGSRLVAILFAVNVFFMGNRILQRHICVYRVYGALAVLPVILRWPLAIIINACANFRATWQHAMSLARGKEIAWAKTSHEIPETLEAAPKLADLVAPSPVQPASSSGGQR
jgi:adsorption protein B